MTNNEPFALAHDAVAGGRNIQNVRAGACASKAILMIDPFPDFSADPQFQKLDRSLLPVIGSLIGTLKQQSKFKLEDIVLAIDEDIYSRFLLAPKRSFPANFPDMSQRSHSACGTLSAFGGFIDEAFREHDYQLGRRNCQQFLTKHFVLPEMNHQFDLWSKEQREANYVRLPNGSIDMDEHGKGFLPIIPLGNKLRIEIPEPNWPTTSESRLDNIETLLSQRVKLMINIAVSHLPFTYLFRLLLKPIVRFLATRKLTTAAMNKIKQELNELNQIKPR